MLRRCANGLRPTGAFLAGFEGAGGGEGEVYAEIVKPETLREWDEGYEGLWSSALRKSQR